MDYLGGALLFALGFLAAFVATRGWRVRRGGGDVKKLSLERGAVRLDLLTGGSRLEKGPGNAGEAGAVPESEAPTDDQPKSTPFIKRRGERHRELRRS